MQGFFFSTPVSSQAIGTLLTANGGRMPAEPGGAG